MPDPLILPPNVQALTTAGASSHQLVVPHQTHTKLVLALSRADRIAAPAILDFVHTTPCPRG